MTAVDLAAVASARAALAAIAHAHPELTTDAGRDRTARWLDSLEADMRKLDPNADSVQVGVRLPPDLLAALDAEVARLEAGVPGVTITRSDAVRSILTRALLPSRAPGAPAPALAPSAPAAPSKQPELFAPPPRHDTPKPEAAPRRQPSVDQESVRQRYRAALDAKHLKGSHTAEAIGCSEPLLRKWSKGDVQNLRSEWLAKLAALLDGKGL